jgi:small-conductance mechanosensitive channel
VLAQLREIDQAIRKIRTDSFWLTLQALAWTCLLVLPLPLSLLVLAHPPGGPGELRGGRQRGRGAAAPGPGHGRSGLHHPDASGGDGGGGPGERECAAGPKPLISFEDFGDNALTLVLRCYLAALDNRLSTITALHTAINDKLNAAGIDIAFPQRDVHLVTRGPLEMRMQRSLRPEIGRGR